MRRLLLSLAVLLVIIAPLPSHSTIAWTDNGWQSTFDCPEADFSSVWNCDGMVRQPFGVVGGKYTQITTAANNPDGGGGRGLRQWFGDGSDTAPDSGNVSIDFPAAESRVWFRFYAKFQTGWTQNWDTMKWVWFEPTTGTRYEVLLDYNGDERTTWIMYDSVPARLYSQDNAGFNVDFFAGSWTCFEVMVDFTAKAMKFWINDELVHEESGMEDMPATGALYIDPAVNARNMNNGQDMYIDFDDFAVSRVGYIGPIGTTPTPDPTPDPTPANSNAVSYPTGTRVFFKDSGTLTDFE